MFSSEKKPRVKDSKDVFDTTPRCGIWGWTPSWLQRFANMQVFVVCYVALGLIYGMTHSYTSSMIPSIEKRFGFTSKSTGIVLAMNDVSHILVALLTAHYGGSSHRPRWISFGCLLVGAALLLHALPEVVFPMKNSLDAQSAEKAGNLEGDDRTLCLRNRATASVVSNTSDVEDRCIGRAESPLGPLIIFGVAQFLLGMGSTALMVLGLPFIDDNTQKKNSGIYMAISFSSRIFGPVLGAVLGAYCNTIFYDWTIPSFKQSDPRWVSAWYLGFLGTGIGLCLFALTMGCFPSSLPNEKKSPKEPNDVKGIEAGIISSNPVDKGVTLKDLPKNVKRLLLNQAYVYGVARVVLEGLIISGYMSFLPKFLGQQYLLSPSAASLAGGVPGVMAIALGALVGGFLTKRFNLQPRHIGIALTFSAVVMTAAFFGAIGLGCEKTVIAGFGKLWKTPSQLPHGQPDEQRCFLVYGCGCAMSNFSPLCDQTTGTNYYSACHAGCQTVARVNETKTYGKCFCAQNANVTWRKNSEPVVIDSATIVGGLCPKKCPNLYVFIVIMFFAMFTVGLPLSGSVMTQYQVVGKELKSMATGLQVLLWSALGLMPGPIIVGTIVDSACDLWQTKSCGEKGFCLLYDTDSLRWKLHLYAGIIKLAGGVLDILLTWKVWHVEFDTEDVEPSSSSSAGPALAGLGAETYEDGPRQSR
ncbi:hypothetical protein RvY_15586 [Ramazzottius varieornatus]|uniref:Solute carrier organic anion transporter family member n=1 Tax=Ramazzottius varieornatus TaxID=947166 RepID=A0A1D1W273_RAMVA|nr:hypothetical protein RvY_15586 [Ramazzottius varieornatus]